jgi:hypothetical protein
MATGQSSHRLLDWFRRSWPSLLSIGVGIAIALTVYVLVHDRLVPPFSDEDIEMMEPWRLAALNFVYYLPICLTQWLVLRRCVPSAFQWVVATITAVCVAQPTIVGILWTFGHNQLAFLGWQFGLGSGIWAVLCQWLVLRRWIRDSMRWLGAIPLVWMGMLPLVHLPTIVNPVAYSEYIALVLWAVYQSIINILLLYVLMSARQHGNAVTHVTA